MQTKMLALGRLTRLTVAALTLTMAGGTAARAQEATPAEPPAEAAKPATPAGPKEETVEKPDYALFFRALKQLKDSAALGYTSRTTMQVAAKGVSVLANQKLDLVALQDKKMRSDVSLWLGDDPKDARKYLVVGDGANLYTRREGKDEYSVKLLEGVKLSDEMARIGLLGSIYYNSDIGGFLSQTTPENIEEMVEQVKAFGVQMSGSKQGETPIFTVKIAAPPSADAPKPAAPEPDADKEKKEGDTPAKAAEPPALVLRFWVDPDTAQFRQLQMQGQDGANRLTITEKIVRQTNRPVYEAPAFRFTPSAKDAKVADVPVDLFKE